MGSMGSVGGRSAPHSPDGPQLRRQSANRWALAAVVLLAAVSLPRAGGAGDPACYARKDTWQETMRVSREAFVARAREEAARNPVQPFVSDVLRGGDEARHIRVPIAGWKDLYLIVTDDGDYHNDVANWCDAKVIAADGRETSLDTLDPEAARQDWGTFRRDNKSAVGGPLGVAKRVWPRGIGTHANSVIHYALPGAFAAFEAWVGVDVSRGTAGAVQFIVAPNEAPAKGTAIATQLWALVSRDFTDPEARRQIAWEQEDRLWEQEWSGLAELAGRYAAAARSPLAAPARALAKGVKEREDLAAVRIFYHRSRAMDEALATVRGFNFRALRQATGDLAATFAAKYPRAGEFRRRLDALEPAPAALSAWPSPVHQA